MTNFEIVRWVIDHFEGHDYTDDPIDSGGASKFGITLRTLQYARRKQSGDYNLIVTKADVKALTLEDAISVAVDVFFTETHLDKLVADWRVQLIVFDYAFHSGQAQAIKTLQHALGNVRVDGELGPHTIGAAAVFPDQWLLALRVLTSREAFMQRIMAQQQTQRKYLLGWWARTTTIQQMLT